MKLESVGSLQAPGQKLPESDLVVDLSYACKHRKTLGKGQHMANNTTKL